jgi:hypothetical protein
MYCQVAQIPAVLSIMTDSNSIDVTYFTTPCDGIDIILLPGETLTITADVSGILTTATVIGFIGWDERF